MAGKTERRLFLGLDTSAYTTSLALVDQDENLAWECRAPLPVRKGGLGLRQSEAVFSHLQNLPRLWEEGSRQLQNASLCGVAASTRPRPLEDSYMPVFKVCEAFGVFLARSLGLFFLASSHQEGHIMAGLWSAGLPQGRCLVMHLSGGTTEILCADETAPGELSITLEGGTADLNAGQFIDRIGVAMGLTFPAGPGLEDLARRSGAGEVSLPVAVKGTQLSFSGPASHAQRLLERGCDRAALARAVEECIAESLVRAVNATPRPAGCRAVLVVGGVAANAYISRRLAEGIRDVSVCCAGLDVAGDNAVGLAVQARRQGEQESGVRSQETE